LNSNGTEGLRRDSSHAFLSNVERFPIKLYKF
jgi:hypothetical protein